MLRRRRRLCSRSATSALLLQPARVTQQNGGKFLAEALIANFQALDLVGKAVEGNHRRNGGKQPHGGGDQRFEIGRASCRERGEISGVAVAAKNRDDRDR